MKEPISVDRLQNPAIGVYLSVPSPNNNFVNLKIGIFLLLKGRYRNRNESARFDQNLSFRLSNNPTQITNLEHTVKLFKWANTAEGWSVRFTSFPSELWDPDLQHCFYITVKPSKFFQLWTNSFIFSLRCQPNHNKEQKSAKSA